MIAGEPLDPVRLPAVEVQASSPPPDALVGVVSCAPVYGVVAVAKRYTFCSYGKGLSFSATSTVPSPSRSIIITLNPTPVAEPVGAKATEVAAATGTVTADPNVPSPLPA